MTDICKCSLLLLMVVLMPSCLSKSQPQGTPASKPLFRDPVYDGAADPVVIWNETMGKHLMYYTNRRANVSNEEGVRWVHGTHIGVAQSSDGGASWAYLDTCIINYHPDDEATYWAPEIIEYGGTFHMYLSYVPGIFADWSFPRNIIHLSSRDGLSWDFESRLALASDKVLDACIYPLPEGGWRLWYNNEMDKKSMYFADSPDLYHWTDRGKVHGLHRGEGAKVFKWIGRYWMLVDEWRGLGVYHSDNLLDWVKQEELLLSEPGTGADDGVIGQHCDVVANEEHAYIFYFTHPGRRPETDPSDARELQRSSLQVSELIFKDSSLNCKRDEEVFIELPR